MTKHLEAFIFQIKKLALSYLKTGLNGEESLEVTRKIYLLNTMLFIGASNCYTIGIFSILTGYLIHGLILIATGLSLILPYYRILKFRDDRYGSIHILILFGSYLVYLFITGGIRQSGIFWYYLYPIAALFLMGCRKGTIIILTLYLTSFGLYYYVPLPFPKAQYELHLLTRFVITSISVYLLTIIYEKSRAITYKKLLKLNSEFAEASRTDYLTHIYNRRGGQELLKEQYSNALAKREQMAILICDIDHFKQINDNYGHEFGDQVLQKVTAAIGETLRGDDIIARWGGEEFLIILPDTEITACRRIAERIRAAVEKIKFYCNQSRLTTTISIGGKPLTWNLNLKELLAQADTNLYHAKRTGRNRVIVN